MSYTADLLDGMARLLADAEVATYRPDGAYRSGETAITIGGMPPAPDRVVCLTAYPVADDPRLTDCTTGVQIRTRAGADPRAVDALDDAVTDVLHGSGPHRWGTALVALISRQSAAPMGADEAGRWERTSNYYARSNRAGRHLE